MLQLVFLPTLLDFCHQTPMQGTLPYDKEELQVSNSAAQTKVVRELSQFSQKSTSEGTEKETPGNGVTQGR